MNFRVLLSLVVSFVMLIVPCRLSAQGDAKVSLPNDKKQFLWDELSGTTTLKINGAYALVGVINPQVEFRLSPHSAFQTEFVYSPWQSIFGGHPMHFGILLNE